MKNGVGARFQETGYPVFKRPKNRVTVYNRVVGPKNSPNIDQKTGTRCYLKWIHA